MQYGYKNIVKNNEIEEDFKITVSKFVQHSFVRFLFWNT